MIMSMLLAIAPFVRLNILLLRGSHVPLSATALPYLFVPGEMKRYPAVDAIS